MCFIVQPFFNSVERKVVISFFIEFLSLYSSNIKLYQIININRYVDDTFVIWPHGLNKLNEFLNYINNIHSNIKFTVEIEKDNELPFLDVLVYKKNDGTLGHKIYRKPTHTNRYLHAQSNHAPSQKNSLINTLIVRANRVCDKNSIKNEITTLRSSLLINGLHNKTYK